MSHSDWSTCTYPCQHPLYLSTSIVRSYVLYSQLPCQHCTDCTVNIFLPVWPNEQIVISWSYNVCLSPFKFCWVHNVEAYAHVHFEEILRTFIFRPFKALSGSWIQFWINVFGQFQQCNKKDIKLLKKDFKCIWFLHFKINFHP
jgi:hypothetical protein